MVDGISQSWVVCNCGGLVISRGFDVPGRVGWEVEEFLVLVKFHDANGQ